MVREYVIGVIIAHITERSVSRWTQHSSQRSRFCHKISWSLETVRLIVPIALNCDGRLGNGGAKKLFKFLSDQMIYDSHQQHVYCDTFLTHWGRVAHIWVSDLTIIGSDNSFSPCGHQAIVSTFAGVVLILTLGTNFSEILREINTFSVKKMYLKLTAKWRRFCLALNLSIPFGWTIFCCFISLGFKQIHYITGKSTWYYAFNQSKVANVNNTLSPRQNCPHFADIFKCIFLNANIYILLKISLKFVPTV